MKTEWNSTLYDNRHSFVAACGSQLIDLLQPASGEHIIDLGCGTGDLSAEIVERGARVLGIDSSEAMLEKAREKWGAVKNLRFEDGDVQKLSYRESFDAAFSNATLHWVPEPELAAHQIYSTLKPGGRFIAEFGGAGNTEAMLASLTVAAREAEVAIRYPWFFPTCDEYQGILESAGFRVNLIQWFRRPTELQENGFLNWYRMFVGSWWQEGGENMDAIFHSAAQRRAPAAGKPEIADYVRIRVVAVKESKK